VSTTPRRAALVVPLLLAGLGLNACGVAEQQIRPGVAAEVDGTEISTDDLDRNVDGTCDFLDAQPDASAFPRVTVRRLLVETLVREEAARRLVEDLDVELPDEYDDAVAGIDQTYTEAPDDQAEAMRTGDKASTYVALAGRAIGDALLREETGTEPGNPELIAARGAEAIDDWIADNDVELNPTYGLGLDGGTFVADDGLSVPASSGAVFAQGVAGININDPDSAALGTALTDAVAELPATQVCGPSAG
jgi:hypothetical protein